MRGTPVVLFVILISSFFANDARAYVLIGDAYRDLYGSMPYPPYEYDGPNDWKWASGSTITYKFHASVPAEFGELIHQAFDAWWDTGIDLYFEYDSTIVSTIDDPDPHCYSMSNCNPPEYNNGTTFYYTNVGSYFGMGAVAFTNLNVDNGDGTILDAPVYINNSYEYGNLFADEPNLIYNLILHEIGHMLGLAHTDDPAAIMYPGIDIYTTDVERNILSQDDIDGVRYLFGLRETSPVPEPATIVLLFTSLIGIAGSRYKTIKKSEFHYRYGSLFILT